MNIIEDQILEFKLATEEYIKRKDELDNWYISKIHGTVVEKEFTIRQKLAMLCDHFQLEIDDITKQNKNRGLVTYRQIFAYILKADHHYTCIDIGKVFCRDHSTIVHSVSVVKDWLHFPRNFSEENMIYHEASQLLLPTIKPIK